MKRLFITLFAGAVGCALALQLPLAADAKSKEKVLHSFGRGTDGKNPATGLIDVKGTLYGTAEFGSSNKSCYIGHGCGIVFSVNAKTGAEAVVYSFCSQQKCADGQNPYASLIDVKGTLYGTTIFGGTYTDGTVFSINLKTGTETVLYSFAGYPEGASPAAGLIDVKGTLYGTTEFTGENDEGCFRDDPDCGTVFSLDPQTGAETVLHSFGVGTDGKLPEAGLIDVKGTLYGTTDEGGSNTSCDNSIYYGCGTVFSIDPTTGAETVVYSFCSQGTYPDCTDGAFPHAGLIDVNGILYGTTALGGDYGGGLVFSLDPSTGAETLVYSFCSQQNCKDGAYPSDNLIDVKGALYGTTFNGGIINCEGGCGTVFSVNPTTGAETVAYSFCGRMNCKDGAYPSASLIDVKGTLYGTTTAGGTHRHGTVFALTEP